MELIEFGELSDALEAELQGDEVDPYSMAGSPLRWRAKDHHVGLRDGAGRLIAAAGCVLAEIGVGDGSLEPVKVVGIGGVIVAARYRGQGLGDRIITEAITLAEGLGPAAAMLFCRRDRAGLYARHGFTELSGPVFADQPDGVVEMPLVAMWRPLRAGVTAPAGRVIAPAERVSAPNGRVTVRGLPF